MLVILASLTSFAQVVKKSESGVEYIEDFKSKDLPTIIYFSGYGQFGTDINMLKRVSFYTKFYQNNKAFYNFIIPQHPKTSYSWIWPFRPDGTAYGVEFIRWIQKTYSLDPKRVLLTGHSAGSPYGTAELMPNELGAIAAVSTSSTYQGAVMLAKIGMPLIAFHGTGDTTEPNTFAAGYRACITWYQITGGGSPTWVAYPGVGHGADVYAYDSNSGLKEWIDNVFTTIVTPPIIPLDTVVFSYIKGDTLFHIGQSGKIIKR